LQQFFHILLYVAEQLLLLNVEGKKIIATVKAKAPTQNPNNDQPQPAQD